MKFENIQVEDEVFVPYSVRTGWRESQEFYIPEKVVKVTKTQFVTESNKRFSIKYGRQIGESFSSAKCKGDKMGLSRKEVYDQTEEMNELKAKINLIHKINLLLEKVSIDYNTELPLNDLKEINQLATELVNKLKPE